MPDVVLLDAGPLGIASHPRPSPEILGWISQLLAAGVKLYVPEIADYEVRRANCFDPIDVAASSGWTR